MEPIPQWRTRRDRRHWTWQRCEKAFLEMSSTRVMSQHVAVSLALIDIWVVRITNQTVERHEESLQEFRSFPTRWTLMRLPNKPPNKVSCLTAGTIVWESNTPCDVARISSQFRYWSEIRTKIVLTAYRFIMKNNKMQWILFSEGVYWSWNWASTTNWTYERSKEQPGLSSCFFKVDKQGQRAEGQRARWLAGIKMKVLVLSSPKFMCTEMPTRCLSKSCQSVCLLQADDIRALLIDAMPPDALPSCLKPQATVVSVHTHTYKYTHNPVVADIMCIL